VEDIFEQAMAAMGDELGPPGLERDVIDPERAPVAWRRLFDHFDRHAAVYRTMLGRNGSQWFAARIRDRVRDIMLDRERQRERLPGHRRSPTQSRMPKDVAATFIALLGAGVVAWWLEQDDQCSPEQIAMWFRTFVLHGYAYALGEAPATT
jgi:Transcriptional regulator C-terminal region